MRIYDSFQRFGRSETVSSSPNAPQAGGLPESSRGSKRSADLRGLGRSLRLRTPCARPPIRPTRLLFSASSATIASISERDKLPAAKVASFSRLSRSKNAIPKSIRFKLLGRLSRAARNSSLTRANCPLRSYSRINGSRILTGNGGPDKAATSSSSCGVTWEYSRNSSRSEASSSRCNALRYQPRPPRGGSFILA